MLQSENHSMEWKTTIIIGLAAEWPLRYCPLNESYPGYGVRFGEVRGPIQALLGT